MIDVSFAIVDRLTLIAGAQFAFVGSLADFAALGDVPRSVPAAYVIPLDERATPSEVYGPQNIQQHSATFGVVLVVRHAGDASGARATLALGPLREAVQAALVGWVPPGCNERLQFAGGALAEFMAGGAVAWRDDYTASRLVQRTTQG